jgi:raffinose/stachyose/melibiose transport system permease protein
MGSAAAGITAAAEPRPSAWHGSRLRKKIELTILLTPALVLFVGFVLLPIVIAAYYSLFNWTGYGPLSDFIGVHNYKVAFLDPVFVRAIEHTVAIAVLSLVIQLPLSLGIALLLNRRFRGRTLMRIVVFAPYVLPPAVTAVMWSLMLQPAGFVDQVLKSVGLGIVLLLAGLQSIPAELLEAAAIDGATSWQATRRITVPLLGPTIRIWIFLTVIGSLQVFDIVWILTAGGPANASTTISTYMFLNGFRSLEFGYGTAIAVILFFFCFVFSLLYQRFALRRDTAGALTRAVG